MNKIVFIFLISFLYADVTDIINKIKELESVKIKCNKIDSYNIFISQKNIIQKTVNRALILNAIFQRKANINGVWVKVGDFINGYKVINISDSSVILKKNKKIVVLTSKNHILKVKK